MIKPLYTDAIAYFEKLEKKHACQADRAKWQAVNRKLKTFSGKRNTPSWQWRHCGKWRDEEYGDTTPFENIGLPM